MPGTLSEQDTGMDATAEHGFNAVNRGVYIADNLSFLRSLNDECIDLVCVDPPFAKNDTFTGDRIRPPLSAEEREIERRLLAGWGVTNAREAEAAGIVWPDGDLQGGYRDIWSWEGDIHEEWLTSIEEDYPAIHGAIETARLGHSDGMAAYLCYMAIRLLEIHRVIKPSGCLYLHCDDTAGAHLHQLLEVIFGPENYRNEIKWRRTSAHSDSKRWSSVIDTIMYFAKSESHQWNPQRGPYDAEYVNDKYRHDDNDGRGRYRLDNMTSPNPRPNMMYEWQGHASPQKGWRYSRETMAQLDSEGRIWYPDSKQRRPQLKRYLSEMPGRLLDNFWGDIPPINSQARERTGYPTQKPVALAERIIAASTNPGDVVLDCFAGCAYAGVAAERLGRQWVACDFNPRAWTVFKRQFNKPSLALLRCNDETTGQQVLGPDSPEIAPMATVHGPTELPTRTSPEVPTVPQGFELPERRFKVPASIIPERQMLEMLLELSGYMAWCCGYANRMPDGSIIRTTRNFHLDHIAPRSREGTSNEIQNRAPMCPYHNIRKNNRQIALSQYRQEIGDAGEMMVNSVNDLINLDYALARAMEMYGQAYAARTADD